MESVPSLSEAMKSDGMKQGVYNLIVLRHLPDRVASSQEEVRAFTETSELVLREGAIVLGQPAPIVFAGGVFMRA